MNARVTLTCAACGEQCDALYDVGSGPACGDCVDREVSANDEPAYDAADERPDYAPDSVARRW